MTHICGPATSAVDNGELVREFISRFATRDVDQVAALMHPNIRFEAYGDAAVVGRDQVAAVWRGVFRAMAAVEFSTLLLVADGDLVMAEQIHGLALPGRSMARIRNMAVYRIEDGLIAEWRDYTNPEYARTLM
jgi:limonene-1,2-epoxide hydrolase